MAARVGPKRRTAIFRTIVGFMGARRVLENQSGQRWSEAKDPAKGGRFFLQEHRRSPPEECAKLPLVSDPGLLFLRNIP